MKQRLCLVLTLVFLSTSCDFTPVKRLFGTVTKTVKKEAKKAPVSLPVPVAVPEVPAMPPPPPPQNLKEVAPAPEETSPLNSFLHLGGAPAFLAADSGRVYMGSGRVLTFYDANLSPSGSVRLEAPIVSAYPGGALVIVKEEGNILEIVKGGEIIKSFQAAGNFDFSQKLFVYLPDKIQVLDLANPDQISVLFEIPLGGASQVVTYGDYAYVAVGTNINVVVGKDMSVLSSVPVGVSFKILGVRPEGNNIYLVLALKSAVSSKWHTIQFMPLSPGGGGITDQGSGVTLEDADEVTMDSAGTSILLLRAGHLSSFDFKTRQEIKTQVNVDEPVLFAATIGGVLFAASQNSLARFAAGGTAIEKKIPLAGDVTSLALTGDGSMVVVNAHSPTLFTTPSILSGQNINLVPLSLPGAVPIQYAKYVDTGVFLYDKKNAKVFSVSADLTKATPWHEAKPAKKTGSEVLETTPDGKTGLRFNEQADGAFISVIDLTAQTQTEVAKILQVSMTREQFLGATFASGGQALILPQDFGVAIYDISHPSNPVLSFKWPLGKAYFADVTGRGTILCVALGEKGIECGKFAPPPQQPVPSANEPPSTEEQQDVPAD